MINEKDHGKGGESAEQKLLGHCETTIAAGIKNFLAVGQALATIREKRLYKLKGYATFERYCQDEWKITRQHASNLIAAFKVEEELSTVVDKPVLKNERQGRQYRNLDNDGKQAVKAKLQDGDDIDAALEAVTKKERPSASLRIKGMVIRLCNLLHSTTEPQEAYDALQPVLVWAEEYEHAQQALKDRGAPEPWMEDLQSKYSLPKAA